ncbi:tripartite tricarboxylate transporter substrate binding protein [Pseudarthrobacter sulfonivorans]|nr:tripartite tricarboxylate transporter substrate binding protein [Pseudarthrobacter sulfonivorans]
MKVRTLALALIPLAMLATACAPANTAANYPTKAIEMVVPFNAGGATDIAARVISEAASDDLGVPVNVVNKPGANQVTAVDSVNRAAPDGYTLLADGAGSSSLQALAPNLPYKWEDRKFVARILSGSHVYAVGKDSPSKTLDELMTKAKANPGGFKVAWLGGSSTSDFALLQLLVANEVDVSAIQRVPFRSSGEGMIAAAANDVDIAVGGASAAFSLHSSGDLNVLASTGKVRETKLPDVKTTTELGQPDVNILYWVGVSGAPKLPDTVAEKLAASLTKISENEDFKKKADGVAMTVDIATGEEFANDVKAEAETFKALAAELG